MKDYYSILGLDRDCTRDDIKNAYRRLAKQYHPDINHSPDAPEKFRAIVEAYEYLLDVKDGKRPDIPKYTATSTRSTRATTGNNSKQFTPLEKLLAMLDSADVNVKRQAIEELGSRQYYSNQTVISALLSFMKSPNMMLRRNAIISLGRLGNPIVVADVAKGLKDDWAQIRFDTAVALGNIGAPEALLYLQRMDSTEYENNEMVMNAVRESIYWIKRKNKMFDQSRKCPYCEGYDNTSVLPPFVCHDCGRTFQNTAKEQPKKPQPEQRPPSSDTTKRCSYCYAQDVLEKCRYCGGLYCSDHISSQAHHCTKSRTDTTTIRTDTMGNNKTEKQSPIVTAVNWIYANAKTLLIALVVVMLLLATTPMLIGALTTPQQSEQSYTPQQPPLPTDSPQSTYEVQYGDISGQVYKGTDQVSHATISYKKMGDAILTESGYVLVPAGTPQSVTTDNNGYYSITHLQYGNYSIMIWDGSGSSIIYSGNIIVDRKTATVNFFTK